nr:reverse transcriptase domain-containing protein [Tanacetum cinerariifolium]
MVQQAKLKLDLVGKPVDHTDYHNMIGSLMYVTSSRRDIKFATCMCAGYQADPNEHHVLAIKRIFCYLKWTINLGLWYPKDYGFDLTAYSEADHAGYQDSLNAAAGGNLLEKSPQDALTIIENKFKVKAVEEICVTYGGAHPYYQCLAAGGNTFPEFRDNIQGYVSAAAGNYNQGHPGSGSLSGNTVANPKGELKAITTRSGLVIDGPTVPTPPKSVTPEEDECVEETYTDPDLVEYTIRVPHPPVQKPKPLIPRHFVLNTKDSSLLNILELKCKALADLGASINLMPLSVWKKLGLPDLIPTRMTLELANRAICTADGIARDVFVPVGKFTFPADFVVVDYESDPRVPLILGIPFLRTDRALIDVYGEEIILCDGDERLTLNMKHDTGCNFLSEELPDIDSFNDIHPYFDDNPLSGSTTYLSNSLLKEFTDELALITYPPDYDDNLKYLANRDDLFIDHIPEMFTDEHAPDYSFLPRFDVYLDDFLKIESDDDKFYDDPFDSKGEKIKESELLIDELDLPCDILPYSKYDSFASQDFSRDDDFPSPDNEDKVFKPVILIHEKSVTIITRVALEKKLAISFASLVFKAFDPPFYEPLVFKDVPNSMRLLPFSSENEEKVFKPGIYTSAKVKKTKKMTKSDQNRTKNGKRVKAGKSLKQLQWVEEEKLNKTQKEWPETQTQSKAIQVLKE